MSNYWSRNDTREWISQLEHRISDIDYYLNKTIDWCEEYGVEDDRLKFMCSFITCVWVSQMRGEHITFSELMEIIGVKEWDGSEEKIYELDERFANLDHYELLEKAVEVFNNDSDSWG